MSATIVKVLLSTYSLMWNLGTVSSFSPASAVGPALSFQPPPPRSSRKSFPFSSETSSYETPSRTNCWTALCAENDNKNPIAEFFNNMDDIVDDFFNKRMGKGEIFYGKRKYKPSGEVEGKYNGFGLSDFQKIEQTKQMKEEWEEERRFRMELQALRDEKEKRN